MSELKMNVQGMTNFTSSLATEIEEYKSIIDELNKEVTALSSGYIWKGALNQNFSSQFLEFLPNLNKGSSILEKTKTDLSNCIQNDTITDQR